MPALFLIRHAEPATQGVFLGQLNPPLSPAGREQAAALSHLEVAIAYSSPLKRARETARFLPCPNLIELPDLREIDYGLWTGKSWSEIQSAWPDLAARKSNAWLDVTPPQAESWPAFLTRIHAPCHTIAIGPHPAAVVAHHAVNAALAHLLTGQNPLTFSQNYGEIICVEFAGTNPR